MIRLRRTEVFRGEAELASGTSFGKGKLGSGTVGTICPFRVKVCYFYLRMFCGGKKLLKLQLKQKLFLLFDQVKAQILSQSDSGFTQIPKSGHYISSYKACIYLKVALLLFFGIYSLEKK